MISNLTPLQQRLTVSSVGTLIALVIIFLSPIPAFKPFFTLAIAATICMAMWELYQIYRAKGVEPAGKVGLTFGALYAFATAIDTQYSPAAAMLPELILLISMLSCFFYYFLRGSSPLFNLSATMFGIIYLAVPLSCMIRVAYYFSQNHLQDGRWWLLYLVTVTKMTDTGGFFIGKKFGKEKLAPHISPKKTWEGALGGLCAAIFSSVLIKLVATIFDIDAFELTWWQSLWLGAGIGIFAQCGDLSESLLKRDGGVKDSNQLPGLGGILDIVDSLVFSSPLVYIFLRVYFP